MPIGSRACRFQVSSNMLDIKHAERQIGRMFSCMFFPFAVLPPLIMAMIFSDAEGMLAKAQDVGRDAKLLLLVGFVYAVVQVIVAGWVGRELPCMLAGMAAMGAFIVAEKIRQGTAGTLNPCTWTRSDLKRRLHWLPFGLLIVVLLVLRLGKQFEGWLTCEG